LDEFPEAFKRFEKRVDVNRIRSFDQLTMAFSHWAGRQWRGTEKQVAALKIEAAKRGIFPIEAFIRPREAPRRAPRAWRRETDRLGRIHFRDLLTGRFIRRPER